MTSRYNMRITTIRPSLSLVSSAPMAQELWAQQSVQAWADARANISSTMELHASDKLKSINSFYEEALPRSIASRALDGRHITQPELVQLVEWKLARGKWRPRLLDYAKSAQAQDVEAASRQAFSLLLKGSDAAAAAAAAGGGGGNSSSRKRPAAASTAAAAAGTKKQKQRDGSSEAASAEAASPAEPTAAATEPAAGAPPSPAAVQAALDALTVIKGVGPATASALLAAADSSGSVPFMADEALTSALGRRDYTAKAFSQLVQELRAKADWLNQQSPGSGWTALLVERCLHAAELAARPPPKAAAAAAGGGKKKSQAPARKKK